MNRSEKLMQRTCQIIEKHGRILVVRHDEIGLSCRWYIGCWTNLAAGKDRLHWSRQKEALSFSDLEVALAIARLYKCRVVVAYPKNRKKETE